MTLHAQFKENGFVLLEDVISPTEIESVFSEIDYMLDMVMQNLKTGRRKFARVDEKYLHLKSSNPLFSGRVYDLMKQMQLLLAVAMKPRIIDFVRSVFQGPVLLDLPQIRIDDPSNLRALPMHQEGFGQISTNTITAWTPLQDVSVTTGTMAVIPGSHKLGFLPHQFYADMSNAHGVCREYVDPGSISPISVKAGTAVVFDARLIHGTVHNSSNKVRWTAICRYCDPKQAPYLLDASAPMRIPQSEEKHSADERCLMPAG
jgi:ectoine hydroxylase-related dioxygenase (phytanoyl-CoA dioxygenase family)